MVGFAAAFAAGMVLSPYVLPLVPAYVSYVAGQSERSLARRRDLQHRLAARALSGVFVLGFGAVFVAGITMMTGHLSRFALWLLETFPALGRIG